MIDPILISTGLQVIKIAADSLAAYQAGDMTSEELEAAWATVGINVAAANAAWEASKASSEPAGDHPDEGPSGDFEE